jgi:hypothetical protein
VNRKSKSKYGEKFPMTRSIAQMRAELKQKPVPKPEEPVGAPGDGQVQPLPGEREPMFLP